MRGRRPAGSDYVEQLDGSPLARQRAGVILETLAGRLSVLDACEQLAIGPTRFHQLRESFLRAAIDSLEPQRVGRPSKNSGEADRQTMQATINELEEEVRAARLGEEIAHVLPRAAGQAQASAAAQGKKRPSRTRSVGRRSRKRSGDSSQRKGPP